MKKEGEEVGREIFKGDWYTYKVIDIDMPNDKAYHYEFVTRTNKCNRGGVEVIPILKKQNKLHLILVKNFRYPINSYCLEFPGGMIDENETVEQAAKREVWEETGYTITEIVAVEKAVQVDPWKSDDTNTVVIAMIDGDAEINQHITLHLDATERINLIILEWGKVESELCKLKDELAIMNSIGYFLTFKKFFNLIHKE